MIQFDRLRNNRKLKIASIIYTICIILVYIVLPKFLINLLFPLIALTFVPVFVVFLGNELYQLLKIKFSNSNNFIVTTLLNGDLEDKSYFIEIDDQNINGHVLPFLLYVSLSMILLSGIIGVIISFFIGVVMYTLHMIYRTKVIKIT